MVCEVCGGDFPHGAGAGHCLTYGGRVMCHACLILQPTCESCGKRRMGIHMRGGLCEECFARQYAEPEDGFIELLDDGEEDITDIIPEAVEALGIDVARDRLREVIRETTTRYTPPEYETKSGICDICGERHKRLTKKHADDKWLCAHCLYTSGHCRSCGELRLLVNGKCRECTKKKGAGIEHRWNYRPDKFTRWGSSDDKLYMGIENEVEMDDDTEKAYYIVQLAREYYFDEAYTMHDGTINYGTEVVFHPRTFKAIKDFNFEPMFKGIKPHQNTGMHVHLSRSGFSSKTHLYKFMRFFARNKAFTERVAERKSGRYRAWTFTDSRKIVGKLRGDYDMFGENKYVDINLKHPETIEVRIFKGAVTTEQLMKNVEFCHALWRFSKRHPPKDMRKVPFIRWVMGLESDYPNLVAFLKRSEK